MRHVRITFGDLEGLHQKMCKMMDEVFSKPGLRMHGWRPAVDIYEEGPNVVLVADLAGVEPGDIEVTLDGSLIRIAGCRRVQRSEAPVNFYQLEIDHGQFERIFRLPVAIDDHGATASLNSGYLRVVLPKRAVEVRSINVEQT